MLLHAADAYNQITEENKEAVPSIKGSYQKETFFVSLPDEFSKSQCEQYALCLGVCERTARRWIEGWMENGQIERLSHGNYQKVC